MCRVLFPLLVFTAAAFAAVSDRIGTSLEQAAAFFEKRLADDPEDYTAANQYVDRLLRRYRWEGKLTDLRRAEEVAALSLKAAKGDLNPGGVASLAMVQLGLHRFAEARDLAGQLEELMPGKPLPSQVRGDALLELGDLAGAEAAFAELLARSEPGLATEYRAARLAWMRGKMDETLEHLDAVVAFAKEDPSSELQVWALVQRGEFAFRCGRHAEAEKEYAAAAAFAPQQWSVLSHLAELRGAQGKYEEAARLFQAAAEATDRPELWQALGDLHLFYQKPDAAKPAYASARRGYDASLARHEVIYGHHLAAFYADSEPDPKRAVAFAQEDLARRKTAASWDALAWALYRSGDFAGASSASEKALADGIRDSHILYHAGTIHLSAGDIAHGQRLLREAAAANPHFAGFHIHQ